MDLAGSPTQRKLMTTLISTCVQIQTNFASEFLHSKVWAQIPSQAFHLFANSLCQKLLSCSNIFAELRQIPTQVEHKLSIKLESRETP